MKKLIILLGFGILLSNQGWSQRDKQCVEVIKAYNNEIGKIQRPKGKQVYLIDYSTEIQYWDKYMPIQSFRTKMYMSEDYLHYFSDVVDIFSDPKYIATVLKDQKKIVFTLNGREENTFENYQKMMKAKNDILDSASVVSCNMEENGNGKLILDPSNLRISNFYVKKLIYEYNHESGEVVKTVTEYSEQYDIRKMTVINHSNEFNSKYKGFKSVKKIFFKSSGELIDKYRNYEIIVD